VQQKKRPLELLIRSLEEGVMGRSNKKIKKKRTEKGKGKKEGGFQNLFLGMGKGGHIKEMTLCGTGEIFRKETTYKGYSLPKEPTSGARRSSTRIRSTGISKAPRRGDLTRGQCGYKRDETSPEKQGGRKNHFVTWVKKTSRGTWWRWRLIYRATRGVWSWYKTFPEPA